MALPSAAQANWGRNGFCSTEAFPVNHHCYAYADDTLETWATIGLQETRYSTVYDCANGEAFVDNEMWTFPESKVPGGWIEAGQMVGAGYCDQEPHIFFAERSPTRENEIKVTLSSLPTYAHQYNWFAISDLPEKNGRWHTYWRIPEESSTWSAGPVYGGGWSPKMYAQKSGMEASTNVQASYEGSEETAYTNQSITPYEGWYNWYGAKLYGEEGSTCFAALPQPGNANVAVC